MTFHESVRRGIDVLPELQAAQALCKAFRGRWHKHLLGGYEGDDGLVVDAFLRGARNDARRRYRKAHREWVGLLEPLRAAAVRHTWLGAAYITEALHCSYTGRPVQYAALSAKAILHMDFAMELGRLSSQPVDQSSATRPAPVAELLDAEREVEATREAQHGAGNHAGEETAALGAGTDDAAGPEHGGAVAATHGDDTHEGGIA